MNESQKKSENELKFDRKLLDSFISADIPLHKLSHPKIRKLLQSDKNRIKHPNTYRRLLHSLAESKIEDVKKIVGKNDVFFIIDETPDCRARNVVNVLVGVLNGEPTKAMLLALIFLKK